MAPLLAAPERFAVAERDAAEIARNLTLSPPATILDLGCGAGVHAIAFAARGFAVTAVDRTRLLLDRAGAEATARSLAIEFVEADMRDFVRPAAFDLACSLYASFGYFDDDDNARVLRNIRASLRDGGTLLLDVLSHAIVDAWPKQLAFDAAGRRYTVERTIAEQSITEKWRVDDQQFVTTQRLYAPDELQSILASECFTNVRFAGESGKRMLVYASR